MADEKKTLKKDAQQQKSVSFKMKKNVYKTKFLNLKFAQQCVNLKQY